MCPDKVQAIQDWPTPKRVREVQAFLGFANFYQRFIEDYSKITVPLTKLTRKNEPFEWTNSMQEAFEELYSQFLRAPILLHLDFERSFIIETDALDIAIKSILSQHGRMDTCTHAPIATQRCLWWKKITTFMTRNY